MQSQTVTFQSSRKPDFSPGSDDSIALCTLNARYIHASLGLRYLLANMGVLQQHTRLFEFTINHALPILQNSCWPQSLKSLASESISGTLQKPPNL